MRADRADQRAARFARGHARDVGDSAARTLTPARATALTLLAAVSDGAAFPPLAAPPLAGIVLVPFLVALGGTSPGRAAALGLLFALAAGAAVVWWAPRMLEEFFHVRAAVAWLGAAAIVLGTAAPYFVAFALWLAWAARLGPVTPLVVGAAWTAADATRCCGRSARCARRSDGTCRRPSPPGSEFLGDGLMAVFAAPEPLARHARAAVQAGREIVRVVARLADGPDATPIAVGVGIATGPAFVGNVRAVDRLIYTAVGDTVNLAARLQSLTRDLAAAMAIDASTYDAGGDATVGLEPRPGTPIRGRDAPVDVSVLPLSAIGR